MPIFVLLIGLALPLMELAVLVKVGQAVGLWRLLLLLLGMAVLGAALLYWQGWTALRQTQDALLRGEPPVGSSGRRRPDHPAPPARVWRARIQGPCR